MSNEDAGAARIVRRARRALAAGDEILLPKSMVDRLVACKNPARVLKSWRGMTKRRRVVAEIKQARRRR